MNKPDFHFLKSLKHRQHLLMPTDGNLMHMKNRIMFMPLSSHRSKSNAIVLAGIIAALNAFSGTALAGASAFEGLPWGATEAEIRDRYGDKVKLSPCGDKEREEKVARSNVRACGSPIVEEYAIDGIAFLAFFNMGGPEHTLNTVYLDRVATVTNDQIKRGEGAELRYNRVKKVLTKRYGDPVEVSETKERPVAKPAILHSKWIVDGTVISLTDTIVSESRGQMYYLSVVYKPLSEVVKPL